MKREVIIIKDVTNISLAHINACMDLLGFSYADFSLVTYEDVTSLATILATDTLVMRMLITSIQFSM